MPSRSKATAPFSGRSSLSRLGAAPVITTRSDLALSQAAPIPLEQVEPNPHNARRVMRRNPAFAELKASIREHGLLQPIVVRKEGVRRILIAGHRRFLAVQELAAELPDDPRWRKILAVERTVDAATGEALSLIENLLRADLEPLDEAGAFVRLRDAYGLSLAAIAERIHKSKMYVSNRVRLASDPVLSTAVAASQLPVSTAEVLLRAPKGERAALAQQAANEDWSVERAREAVLLRRTHPDEPLASPPTRQVGLPVARLVRGLRADVRRLEVDAAALEESERADLHALFCQGADLTAPRA